MRNQWFSTSNLTSGIKVFLFFLAFICVTNKQLQAAEDETRKSYSSKEQQISFLNETLVTPSCLNTIINDYVGDESVERQINFYLGTINNDSERRSITVYNDDTGSDVEERIMAELGYRDGGIILVVVKVTEDGRPSANSIGALIPLNDQNVYWSNYTTGAMLDNHIRIFAIHTVARNYPRP
ncbi:MAG: hypothetical protein HQK53_03170 [Oligoflexia bacterium]|nr:hypothetical protein [Oligoflexia bacterium]